jgi:tetratricopeptide (TPR) repeat protein
MLSLPRALHMSTGSLFAGRETELGRLRQIWTQMARGQRVAALVSGDAGIGKTRLAAEFARAVHGEGALVLYGRCDEGLAVPYQPFVEALRPYARAASPARLHDELGDLAPELGRLVPELAGLGEPIQADPESDRFALFEAVAALIEAMTRDQPTLFVLDDLHWATNPTLLLLRHLIRCERRLGVLLLCTYRETELDLGQPLAQLVADLHRDASVKHVSLGGLDETAMRALLEAAVGQALHDPAALVRVLGTQTAGNPFFLRELLAHVAESGAIGDERLGLTAMAARLVIPEGLRHVIGQRVARLTAPAGRALHVAAVAGATFSFVLLERVLGEESGVLDALDEAVAAGLLIEAGHGDYVFAHALVRQTIYGQLSTPRRIRLHRQLGEALEAQEDADAHVEALAYHFAQAAPDSQAVKAADYALVAGRHATARLGHEDAAAHYERGLQALTRTGQRQHDRRCELLLALGEARWDAGELDQARQAYGQATELADSIGDAAALARAALGFCGGYHFEARGALTVPIAEMLQHALTRSEEEDNALRARLMGRLAVLRRQPVLAAQALEMARRLDDIATLTDVLASTLWATSGPDAVHQSIGLAQELARATDAIADRRLHALTHAWLADQLLCLGDIDGVERELEALQHLAETRRERYFTWLSTLFRASHAFLQGRLQDCETLAQDALAHGFTGRDEPAARAFRMQLLWVRREQGELHESVKSTEDFIARAAQDDQLIAWRCTLASIYAHLGQTAQAREALEALARADFEDLPRDLSWLYNLSALGEVAIVLGDRPRVRLLYNLLLPFADRCIVPAATLCQGSASRALGLLATTLSRFDDAAQHFEHALMMNARIRSPLWVAHTQHEYARMRLERNRRGDRDDALRLLTNALDTAEQLGLTALATSARSLMQTAIGTEPSPPLARPV